MEMKIKGFHGIGEYHPEFNTIKLAKLVSNQKEKNVNELLTQLSKLKTEMMKQAEGLQFRPDVGPIACCCCCCK